MSLRLVHLEDDPNDRELVARALADDGVECVVVNALTREEFESALGDALPDLILADYSLPGFDGATAQTIAARRCPDVPFIFVSGSLGEDVAVELMRGGATDYVLKHRVDKLPAAVRRALREAENQRERSRAEDDLRRLNAELEQRVEERTQALQVANQELERARLDAERANSAKSEFLSRMSHDLRTPLNAIMGFAQVLQADGVPSEQEDCLTHILRGGRHLLELINEVLDIARIEAGRLSLSLEPVGVSDVIQQGVDMMRPLAATRRIVIRTDDPGDAFVLADRQRLMQVLINLLGNAVKYNREGGTVTVSVARLEHDRVAISVSDTGAGIPPEKLALLFRPFERLGAEQSAIEGTGLGLALAKGLAEAMKGSIAASSTVDQGSTFRLELPASQPVNAAVDGVTRDTPQQLDATGTVVYIEDNLPNLHLMRRLLLRRESVRLVHAATGAAGVATVRRERPRLVFLDLHLPDMPGEEVLRRLWEEPATRRIPVAVLSADATPAQRKQLLAAGAIAYLTKPFDIDDVLRLVDRELAPRNEDLAATPAGGERP